MRARVRGGDEGGDDAATVFAGVGQGVSHEVDAAANTGSVRIPES